jgi:transposase-like protein
MNTASFQTLMTELEGLTAEQRQRVSGRVKTLGEQADSARLIAERLGTPTHCAHGGSATVVRFGYSAGQQRCRCKDCGKTFMALTGTPVQRLREREKWVAYTDCMSQGLTLRASAAAVGLTVDRAFRWRHRFLECLAEQRPTGLTGLVEADETLFRRSVKGQRQGLPRAAKSRGGPAAEGTAGERVSVWVAMQRGTRLATDQVLSDGSATAMTAVLRPAVAPDAVLSTDGNPSYRVVATALGIGAGRFVASYDGHGGDGVWHVQNVNAYDSRLKGWMARFHGVATQYLHHYLGWRRLLDRFQDAVTPQQSLFHALRQEYINI